MFPSFLFFVFMDVLVWNCTGATSRSFLVPTHLKISSSLAQAWYFRIAGEERLESLYIINYELEEALYRLGYTTLGKYKINLTI